MFGSSASSLLLTRTVMSSRNLSLHNLNPRTPTKASRHSNYRQRHPFPANKHCAFEYTRTIQHSLIRSKWALWSGHSSTDDASAVTDLGQPRHLGVMPKSCAAT